MARLDQEEAAAMAPKAADAIPPDVAILVPAGNCPKPGAGRRAAQASSSSRARSSSGSRSSGSGRRRFTSPIRRYGTASAHAPRMADPRVSLPSKRPTVCPTSNDRISSVCSSTSI